MDVKSAFFNESVRPKKKLIIYLIKLKNGNWSTELIIRNS